MPTDSENGRLSEKTVSGRRTVKSTRITRRRHQCPQIGPSAESEAEGALEAFGETCHRKEEAKDDQNRAIPSTFAECGSRRTCRWPRRIRPTFTSGSAVYTASRPS